MCLTRMRLTKKDYESATYILHICPMVDKCHEPDKCFHSKEHFLTDLPECIGIDGYQCPGCIPC